MRDILEKVYSATEFNSPEDAIIRTCETYDDLGNLFSELLMSLGDSGFDNQAVSILSDMMRAYIDNI